MDEIDWKARALKAEADLAELRSASFRTIGWMWGSQCNDCTPTGRYGAGGWEGTGPREDGHEIDCGYALAVDKLYALLEPWQAEAYAKRKREQDGTH